MTAQFDVVLLYAARAVRGFGDGFALILLPAYLAAVGFTPAQIGVVATAALLGSALVTLAVGVLALRHSLRHFLLAGAALMIATGAAFAQFDQFAIILVVAFIGTLNPSSGDTGILVPI